MLEEQTISPDDLGEDEPVTLEVAARVFYRGQISAKVLRSMAERGELEVHRVGRRVFTTRADVQSMRDEQRQKWDEERKKRASGCGKKRPKATGYGQPNTSSGTDESSVALVAARTIAQKLKSSSSNTSPKSTQPKDSGAKVIRLRSR